MKAFGRRSRFLAQDAVRGVFQTAPRGARARGEIEGLPPRTYASNGNGANPTSRAPLAVTPPGIVRSLGGAPFRGYLVSTWPPAHGAPLEARLPVMRLFVHVGGRQLQDVLLPGGGGRRPALQ